MRKRWSDEQVCEWAQYYTEFPEATFESLEPILEVSHSTIFWCFMNRLVDIDLDLYRKVRARMEFNKSRRGNHK